MTKFSLIALCLLLCFAQLSLQVCAPGQYDAGSGGTEDCKPCDSSCKTCETSATTCKTCADGKFLSGSTCAACDPSCKTCETSATTCKSCADGKFVNSSKNCADCDTSCKTCSGASPSQCLTCDTPARTLQNSQCVTSGSNGASCLESWTTALVALGVPLVLLH